MSIFMIHHKYPAAGRGRNERMQSADVRIMEPATRPLNPSAGRSHRTGLVRLEAVNLVALGGVLHRGAMCW